jgi:hypothetical protein
MADGGAKAVDVDALVRELRQRVRDRNRQGFYPPDLEADLEHHFERLSEPGPAVSPPLQDDIRRGLQELAAFEYHRNRIDTASSALPGGSYAHRAVGRTVRRQVEGALEQQREEQDLSIRALEVLAEAVIALARTYEMQALQQLDDLDVRLDEQAATAGAATLRRNDVAMRIPGVAVEAAFREDRLTTRLRGTAAQVRDAARDLAAVLAGCSPVLEIGFGRGEFLELLRELGVDARGVERDEALVATAHGRGLDVSVGDAIETLAVLPDASLGGLVMLHVLDHLAPREVVQVVRLASEKLRSGGKFVSESANPAALAAFADSMWTDPDQVRPVHPDFLTFLLREAGFAAVERLDRPPAGNDERLQLLSGGDDDTARLNANFERMNDQLFGPRDCAFVATR